MTLRRYAAVLLLSLSLLAPAPIFARRPTKPAKPPAANPPASAQQPAPAADPNDPIARIREEGLKRSQVMETLSYLSDVIGPRLTASPNMKRANEWTRDQLTRWGLQNAHLNRGSFCRGWSLKPVQRPVSAHKPSADRLSESPVTCT